ncbi:hypothetical protein LMG28688_01340 [Paraburkholderia caffeinitolerans]|uniref:Uncharacterized protein n=2 Tax=Paraburkholderia TaxID=1822464 RepID=A0A6J5FJW6_9BURK|nr:hypothetical protein GCM10011400_61710 [Paraburkholderia caffeinilytica]CAB3781823.1 hypothetical protein LMG28688_01340 [Paraburkholderia caffeinitolerans]CAB3802318.1 hypothetical protein LMG28690_05543 [Paraburkholderia caffeinilytica]
MSEHSDNDCSPVNTWNYRVVELCHDGGAVMLTLLQEALAKPVLTPADFARPAT